MDEAEAKLLAARIESGAYFKEARHWYSELYHMPIAQRSYYIVVILLSSINVYFAVLSFMNVFPIAIPVPFITYSANMWEEIPRIQRISNDALEDKNIAVMDFFIKSYVENRESYDLSAFELRYRNIWSQSTAKVFDIYKEEINASNPYSFYHQYTNRFRRVVDVVSFDFEPTGNLLEAHVVFEAHVIALADNREEAHSKWRADLVYRYTDFFVDQSLDTNNPIAQFFGLTGGSLKTSGEKRKVIPMTFVVSDYKVKELIE